jgi:hypothetical protein
MKKIVFLSALLFAIAFSVKAQCPMCKTALTSNRDHAGKHEKKFGNGINNGILFLLSAPYLLVGGAGFAYYRSVKNRKLKNG